jgi:thymidine phosphorylase
MREVLEDRADKENLKRFLLALKNKGETPEEVGALVDQMYQFCAPITITERAVDTVGTGGDGAHTINISTTAAIIAAAAGSRVVKHGNRAASSKSGAGDLLEALGVAINLGQDKVNVLSHLSNLLGAKGRFETYLSAKDRVLAIVDYAHTPDALLNVLTTIQQLKVDDQQVITVVGCGGNRDADKRPLMAEVAVKYSNQVILTSDNPRFENPSTILDQMEEQVKNEA